MTSPEITRLWPLPGTMLWSDSAGSHAQIITEKESADLIARGVKYIVYKDGKKEFEYQDSSE